MRVQVLLKMLMLMIGKQRLDLELLTNFKIKSFFLLVTCAFISCQKGKQSSYTAYLNHNYTVKYVGKEQCMACHQEIYDSYMQLSLIHI